MKKVILFLTLIIGLLSCNGGEATTANAAEPVKDHVEVIYFHGKQRCATCMAIEKEAKAVVEQQFANDVKNGKVQFRIVDISDPKNEGLANKYEVSWSSLYITSYKNGKETRQNLTEFGFGNARSKPELFKKGLAEKIKAALK